MGLPFSNNEPRPRYAPPTNANPIGPSGSELARPSFDTVPEARRVPRANPLRVGNIVSGIGFFPNVNDGTTIKLEIDRPEIFEIVHPLDGAAGPFIDYFELWASPEDNYPNGLAHFPYYRGVGSRLWLPSPGTWYVGVNCDVTATLQYQRLDAANDAWARNYMDIGSGLSSTIRGGFQSSQVLAPTTDQVVFNIGGFPEAIDILISNVGAAACVVNPGGPTAAGARGRTIAAGGLLEFARGTYAPASIHAYSTAGTSVQIFVGGR